MKPRRFFVEDEPLGPGERLIKGNTARHLSRVLRLSVGERVLLFDGSGCEFPAEVSEIARHSVRVRVGEGTFVDRESPLKIWLGLGLCQPATMDMVIQKTTELGVTEIVPLKTDRAQRWFAGERGASRLRRWERIAREAARQSGRSLVPQISPWIDFRQVLRQRETNGLKLIFWEGEERGSLKQTLAGQERTNQVQVLVGPEGGFSADEIEQATAAGFQSISLGRRVLRTETASIVVIGLLQHHLGDLGGLP
ncbi:MAG: 16S rRNA (uracil(1498)-N(3))-methyltransferase [Deltaproteobacteria bacterium]|nr:MAG: 16S rRNA (uracil(1498)-N(3))-methyltransferase [Deltaproteobacteria bacterium]